MGKHRLILSAAKRTSGQSDHLEQLRSIWYRAPGSGLRLFLKGKAWRSSWSTVISSWINPHEPYHFIQREVELILILPRRWRFTSPV